MLNKDFKDILQSLSDNKAEFLVVGAYAMGAHGYIRATGDIDIWVKASPVNAKRVYKALADFGAPVVQLTEKTFTQKGIVYQVGVPPRRIDILTHIDGVRFDTAFKKKKIVLIDTMSVPFLCGPDLIKNKLATGRAKDKVDAAALKKIL